MKKRILSVILAIMFIFSSATNSLANNDFPLDSHSKESEVEESSIRAIIQLKEGVNLQRVLNKVKSMPKTTVRNVYDTVFNGFSVELPNSYITKIRLWSEVKDVRIVEMYYPLMSSSKSFAQVEEAISSFGNHGEGVLVSVIDSGIDVKHKDLQKLKNPSKAKIKKPIMETGNKDTQFNMKVPYGYNFAEKSYNVYSPLNNHGQHVAGIVGANGEDDKVKNKQAIDGVASEVQLLAMKVFSNNPEQKGAAGDDIIAAIEKSVELNADIINMSLGSDAGFMDDNDPMQRAINKAKEKGTLVVVSAGNSQTNFTDNSFSKITLNKSKRDDFGIVGSPSTARGAISIASYENSNKFVNIFEYELKGKKITGEFSIAQGNIIQESNQIVYLGYGLEKDYDNNRDLNGKFALIKRGEISFTEKVQRAFEHKASGVLVFNNEDGRFGMNLSGIKTDIFAASISKEEGEGILKLIESDPNAKIFLHKNLVQVQNELKDNMSTFSSWGTTSNLDFKPELTGIGGNVYSTDNDNKYVMKSGTSMSAPFVSGASSIVIAELKKNLKSIDNYADFTKKTLMNTAYVLINNTTKEKLPFSPRRQGAGLVQTRNAIENRVIITEAISNEASAALRDFNGKKNFELKLKNYGDKIVSFKIKPKQPQTTVQFNNDVLEVKSNAKINSNLDKITLLPGQEKSVNFILDATKVINDYVEGYIDFETMTTYQPSLSFPYMGYAGDWNSEPIIDDFSSRENPKNAIYGATKLVSILQDKFSLKDSSTIVDLGMPQGADKPVEALMSFSPGNDGFADIVIPQLGILRNAKKLSFEVLDNNKNFLTKINEINNVRKLSLEKFNDRVKKKMIFLTYPYPEGAWDGTKYNSKTGKNEIQPDGQYYIRVSAKLSENYAAQEIILPVKIDSKKPIINIIKSKDGKEYEVSDKGRVIKFTVKDNVGASLVYAKSGKNRIIPKVDDKGIYTLIIPFNIQTAENISIHANDYAYNQTIYQVKGISGNKLSILNWKNIIDKKMDLLGESLNGTVANLDTKKLRIDFVNKKTKTITKSNSAKVINGKFSFLMFNLKEQGRYDAVAVEMDNQDRELRKTSLGELIYDYTPPQLQFNYNRIITNRNEQKRPEKLKNYSDKYVEYEMKLNTDGTATYEGKITDNVFSPNELKLTIGSRSNLVKINEDGSFKYVLQNPSIKFFDFINVSQPSSDSTRISSNIDALDLAIPNKSNIFKNKGKEKTYIVTKYIESEKIKSEKEFKLNIKNSIILGSQNIISENSKDKDVSKVIKNVSGKYFLTLTGYVNNTNVKVFIDGIETEVKKIIDGGRFDREVEIKEGINIYNVRVEDLNGKLLADRKVSIRFDFNLPELTLELPDKDAFIEEEVINSNKEKVMVKYVQTDKDYLVFKGTIRDNGFGYEFRINGNYIASYKNLDAAGNDKYGENIKSFEELIYIEDGDIITLSLKDQNNNSTEIRYVVRKVEKKLEKNVKLVDRIEKLVGEEVNLSDIILENPDNYDVIIQSENINTEYPGEYTILVKVIYDALNVEEFNIVLSVENDKTKLKHAIMEATRIIETSSQNFTSESISNLYNARVKAQKIYDNKYSSKKDIEESVLNIKRTIEKLKMKKEKEFIFNLYVVDSKTNKQQLLESLKSLSESQLNEKIINRIKELQSENYTIFDYERISNVDTNIVLLNYYLIKPKKEDSAIKENITDNKDGMIKDNNQNEDVKVKNNKKNIVENNKIQNKDDLNSKNLLSKKEIAKEEFNKSALKLNTKMQNDNFNKKIVKAKNISKEVSKQDKTDNPNTGDKFLSKNLILAISSMCILYVIKKKNKLNEYK